MLTFKEYLAETRADEKVHRNISVGTLKALTKNIGQMRYVIDKNGKLHAGAAHNFVHHEIDPNTQTKEAPSGAWVQKQWGRENSINGYAEYKNGKFYHMPAYQKDPTGVSVNFGGTDKYKNIRHPLFKKMKEAGFTRHKEEPDFAWE